MLQPPTLRPLACLLVCLLSAGCNPEAEPAPEPGPPPAAAATDGPVGTTSRGVLRVAEPQDPTFPYKHDFGEISFGETVRWSSTLVNDGPEAVTIIGSQAACQCTAVRELEILGPDGASLESHVNFRSDVNAVVPVGGRAVLSIDVVSTASEPNKPKLALVRVQTNSVAGFASTHLTYELRFTPTLLFEPAPSELRLLSVPTSHGGSTFIKILRRHRSDVARILDIESAPEGVEVDLIENEFGGETHWKLYAKLPPMTPMGQMRGKVVLRTTDEDGRGDEGRLTIPVVARVLPDVIANPGIFSFGRLARGTEKTVEVELQGLVPGARVQVLGHALDVGDVTDHFEVEVRSLPPDDSHAVERWRIAITARPELPEGAHRGNLVVTLAEPFGGGQGDGLDELHVPLRAAVAPAR